MEIKRDHAPVRPNVGNILLVKTAGPAESMAYRDEESCWTVQSVTEMRVGDTIVAHMTLRQAVIPDADKEEAIART